MEIRVLIVEDQEAVRLGLAYLVDNSHGLRCAGAFADAETALAELAMLEPDIVLMDIGLPGMSGIEAVRRVKAQRPTTQVMMLTVYEDESRIFESLRAGATGYIPQDHATRTAGGIDHGPAQRWITDVQSDCTLRGRALSRAGPNARSGGRTDSERARNHGATGARLSLP
jgi:CheY-like chemotaxis protein